MEDCCLQRLCRFVGFYRENCVRRCAVCGCCCIPRLCIFVGFYRENCEQLGCVWLLLPPKALRLCSTSRFVVGPRRSCFLFKMCSGGEKQEHWQMQNVVCSVVMTNGGEITSTCPSSPCSSGRQPLTRASCGWDESLPPNPCRLNTR